MAAITAAVIGAAVGVGSLAYSISSSQQQARLASQAKNAAQIDAFNAEESITKQKAVDSQVQSRNLDLSNERRRVAAPPAIVQTNPNALGSAPAPAAAAPGSSPATVTRGTGTMLGS